MTDTKSAITQEKYDLFTDITESNSDEKYQIPSQRQRKNRLVAAIDFGTTYSGYAYAFENDSTELESLLQSVQINEWRSSTGVSTINKAPTTVLFDPDENFHSFGYDAENTYADLVEDEKKDHTEWYCFKRFKMKLHDQMKLNRKFELEDENGHIMPAKKVFAESIKFLKDDLMKVVNQRNSGFDGPNLWVLTVPAIWDEPAKQFMRESTEEAGIVDNMILALEPESAAIYCKTLPHTSLLGTSAQELVDCFSPGGMYMVLDLGGGTVDTAVHGVRDDCSIKEIHKACGGAWGGTKVDEEFLEHIRILFGDNVLPELQTTCQTEWLKLLKRFEEMKQQVTYTTKRDVKLEIPPKMVTISNNIVSDLTKYKTNLTIIDENLKRFFLSPAERIECHIRNILASSKLKIIFMVGGFSESQYIQEYMREKFKDLIVIVPYNARIAVLKGAVIIGFNELSRLENQQNTTSLPFQVMERICRWTYGTGGYVTFIEGEHLEEYSIFIDGEKVCDHMFHVLVREGESVAMFEERSYKGTSTHKEKERRHIDHCIPVFAVKGNMPTYTTADNCRRLGEIIVKPPEGGWPDHNSFSVIMYLGRTEFSVKVIDLTDRNREPYISTFDFLV